MTKSEKKIDLLTRIAESLERISPKKTEIPNFKKIPGAIWQGETQNFTPLKAINHIKTELLIGIEQQRDKLQANTLAFIKGLPANNALLWGARGMGKSALVKAIHDELYNQYTNKSGPVLIEIMREDLSSLNKCLSVLKDISDCRFILFCDDLSFEHEDISYKSLKALLEGGIAGKPENVIFYATSNQRHLIPREQAEYDENSLIHGQDLTNEKISLSDRFGLWLGFNNCSQQDYQKMVSSYAKHFKLKLDQGELQKQAHLWATERGSRSGRVAWQFIQHLRGREES